MIENDQNQNKTKQKGVSCNLRLAKLCSDINKPNGQFKLENDVQSIVGFIERLPIRKMNGIGPSTSLLLECYGIHTCKVNICIYFYIRYF